MKLHLGSYVPGKWMSYEVFKIVNPISKLLETRHCGILFFLYYGQVFTVYDFTKMPTDNGILCISNSILIKYYSLICNYINQAGFLYTILKCIYAALVECLTVCFMLLTLTFLCLWLLKCLYKLSWFCLTEFT